MVLAWKEIKKNKMRFTILGSIIFLISLLTFIISGLANGLSDDNASLINDLPAGQFYMSDDAEQTYNLSKIDTSKQKEVIGEEAEGVAFSIQMGFLKDKEDKQKGVAFVAATESPFFKNVNKGEVILDHSLKNQGVQVGDTLTNPQFNGDFVVKGFVEQKKYSHSPVAFIHKENYQEMYRVEEMQLVFTPDNKKESSFAGLESFSNKEFLNTIPSYSAEQSSLNMIVWFLVIISGMLFAIFFYMMNVQKISLYGILKAIGLKVSALFQMMWVQMLIISIIALALSIGFSQLFNVLAPSDMPFKLTMKTTLQLSAIFLVIGFVGATISGIQIKKVAPLQAIQQGDA